MIAKFPTGLRPKKTMTVIIEFMDDIMENSMDIIDDIIEFIEIFFENSKNRTSDSMTILNAIPDGTFAGRSNQTVVTDIDRFRLRKMDHRDLLKRFRTGSVSVSRGIRESDAYNVSE